MTSRITIWELPVELVQSIADYCSVGEISRLASCSRRLHDFLDGYLYRTDLRREASIISWIVQEGRVEWLPKLEGIYLGDSITRTRHNNGDRYSPIHLAAMGGHTGVVGWLIDRGSPTDTLAIGLCNCASQWRSNVSGANPPVGASYHRQCSPLHLAICHLHVETAMLLISKGADINNVSAHSMKQTALHLAAEAGLEALVQHLLTLPAANVNAANNLGLTPLHYAIRKLDNNSVISLFLGAGADADQTDMVGRSPLDRAIYQHNAGAALQLIRGGADVTIPSFGFTLLHLACQSCSRAIGPWYGLIHDSCAWPTDRLSVVRELVEYGADVDARYLRPPLGATPLMEVVEEPLAFSTIEFLLQHKANPNAQDAIGEGPLHKVCRSSYLAQDDGQRVTIYVKLLLQHGANPALENHQGHSPIDIITQNIRTSGKGGNMLRLFLLGKTFLDD